MRFKIQSLLSANSLAKAMKVSGVHVTEASQQAPCPQTGSFVPTCYAVSHIPKASYTNVMELSDRSAKLQPTMPHPDQFAEFASKRGIQNDDHVVVYDQNEKLAFDTASCRVWWLFKAFGHENVSILNGGFNSWKSHGLETSDQTPVFKESNYKPKMDREWIKYYDDMLKNATNSEPKFHVVDVRSKELFDEASIGHAMNLPFTSLYNEDGSFKDKKQLQLLFKEYGIDLNTPLVSSCQRGMTACIMSFAAHTLDKKVAVYDGSWAEYSSKMDS